MSSALAQPELFAQPGGWVTVNLPAGEKARRREETDGIIRLEVGGQSLTVTREGRGRAGKDRFCANGIRNENGGAVQARGMAYLARNVDRLLKWKANTDARLAKIEKHVGLSAVPAKARSANKLTAADSGGVQAATGFVNPFQEGWDHSHTPDWFERERGPSDLTKRVFGRLLFPPNVCHRYDKAAGVIFKPNIAWLASALGATENGVRKAMTALAEQWKVIKCVTLGNGKIEELRFLNHEWIQKWKAEKEIERSKKAAQGQFFQNPNTAPTNPNSVRANPNSVGVSTESREVEKIENESRARPRATPPTPSPIEADKVRALASKGVNPLRGLTAAVSTKLQANQSDKREDFIRRLEEFVPDQAEGQLRDMWLKRFDEDPRTFDALAAVMADVKEGKKVRKSRVQMLNDRWARYTERK